LFESPNGQDVNGVTVSAINDAMRFAVDKLTILRKSDLRHDAPGIREMLEAVGSFKQAIQPVQCGIGLVSGDVSRFFVRSLDCER